MKESSSVKSIHWFEGLLYVTFKTSTKIYEFEDVPEQVFEDFKNADSLGKFFAANIRGKYTEQKFDEVVYDIPESSMFPFPTNAKKDLMLDEFRLDDDLTEEEEQELLDAINDPNNDGMGGATT